MAPGNARARETISNVLASMYVFSFFAPAGIHPLIGVSFTFLIQDAANSPERSCAYELGAGESRPARSICESNANTPILL